MDLGHLVWAVFLGGNAYLFATSGTGGFGITLAVVFGFLALMQLVIARDARRRDQ